MIYAYPPADDAVDFFRQHGFGRLDGLLDETDRAAIGSIYERCFDPSDTEREVRRHNLGGSVDGRQVLPQVLAPHSAFPELLELPYFARLQRAAAALIGPEARLRGTHMIRKPAGYGSVTPWHQDQAYHSPTQHFTNVNFWMPLEDATPVNGCLHFVPDSHRGVVLPHTRVGTEGGHALVATDQEYWQANSVCVPCPAGSATLHHSYMLHYAGANSSQEDRRAFIVVFALPATPRNRPLVFPWQAKG